MEKDLNEMVAKLRQGAGANLKAVVLYGSAASGEFHPSHSDLNVLCLLDRLDAAELRRLAGAAEWWTRKGHPAPLVFTLAELRSSADLFAIELLDIKAHHRVLFGEDALATLDVPMTLHRAQVERELRTNLVRLRQHYLTAGNRAKAVVRLMTQSVSTFAALFRHALIALGEQPPQAKRKVIDRLASLGGFDGGAFHTALDVREGQRRQGDLDIASSFGAYLEAVERVTADIDRRFAELRH